MTVISAGVYLIPVLFSSLVSFCVRFMHLFHSQRVKNPNFYITSFCRVYVCVCVCKRNTMSLCFCVQFWNILLLLLLFSREILKLTLKNKTIHNSTLACISSDAVSIRIFFRQQQHYTAIVFTIAIVQQHGWRKQQKIIVTGRNEIPFWIQLVYIVFFFVVDCSVVGWVGVLAEYLPVLSVGMELMPLKWQSTLSSMSHTNYGLRFFFYYLWLTVGIPSCYTCPLDLPRFSLYRRFILFVLRAPHFSALFKL